MNSLSPGRNLILIGMMGSGKSAVGLLLAERLGRPFADTDAMVEAQAGRSVAAIFADEGERGFRILESEAIRRVSVLRGQVVSVGGGAVEDGRNVTHLRATGDLVLLTASAAVLAARTLEGASSRAEGSTDPEQRPLLEAAGDDVGARAQVLAELWERRRPAYEAAAATSVDTGGRSANEVRDAVLAWAANVPGLLTPAEMKAQP